MKLTIEQFEQCVQKADEQLKQSGCRQWEIWLCFLFEAINEQLEKEKKI